MGKSPYLHTLKTLMYTVAGSANAFISSLLFVAIVISVFTITFMRGLQNYLDKGEDTDDVDGHGLAGHGEDIRTRLETYFGSFREASYTLLGCITGGTDWMEVSGAVEEI